MKKIINFVVVFVAAIAMSSCGSSLSEKVSIIDVENVSIKGLSGVTADLVLRNESWRNITLSSALITLREKDRVIARLELKDGFQLPKRTEEVTIPTMWRLRDVDALRALAASTNLLDGDKDQSIRFDVAVTGKMGLGEQSFERRGLTMQQIKRMAKIDNKK